ncbi:hypothetical protein [Methyloglobulus sp.]|uniref:hypothetical protein n=1 Tax=Methyloglobulus sp. TaxID=2518622 RepID=UPI0032B85D5F
MDLDNKFTALQLAIINEQAALYTCACPVHISMQITNLRKLFDYQKACMEMPTESDVHMQVHQRIAEVTKQTHQLMEQCLDEILDLEGWDRTKLEMPTGIRTRVVQN